MAKPERFGGGMVVAAVLLVSALLPGARAEAVPGSWQFEIYAGRYDPQQVLGTDVTFGVRFGSDVGRRINVQGTVGYFSTDESDVVEPSNAQPQPIDVEYDAIFAELSIAYLFRPERRLVPKLAGGLGWAFVDVGGTLSQTLLESLVQGLTDDSLTLHFDGSLRIDVSDTVYVRPGARVRWIDERATDQLDTELALAVGFRFGR